MAKKAKKGYLWIFDQQDKWDEAASDKMSQLEQAQAAHLDWFDKHSTVSELLALRRPDLKRKHGAISTATASQIVPSKDVAKESSESMDAESVEDKHAEDVVKSVDIHSLDADASAADKAMLKRQTDDHQTTTHKVNATESQAEHVHKTNTITIPPSKVKPTAIIKPYTAPKVQPEKPKNRSFVDDYDEEDDQVQIVVSARKSNTVPQEKPPRPTIFPTRAEPHVSKSTPSKTISLTSHAKPSNTSTYRSAFMNRLFKTSRPSLKKAALPSASISTSNSSTAAAAAAPSSTAADTTTSPNRRDSYSYHPTIITKRSSTASIRSIGSSIHSTPIQTSDIMPEPRFKRFKALQKLNQDPPAAAAAVAEQATHDLSTVEEVDELSTSQSQPQEAQGQNESQQSSSSQENTEAFVIPAWGEGVNLISQIEKQSNTDLYEFFGRIQPVNLKDMFP